MNRFTRRNWKDWLHNYLPLPILLFIVVIVVFLYGIHQVTDSQIMDEHNALENALMRDISHCYAIEGTYPPSLQYLKDHYGLTYDSDKYIVNYEYVGSNVLPTYRIIDKSVK